MSGWGLVVSVDAMRMGRWESGQAPTYGGGMSETALTPANENPWYVLMTLYGEQTGEEVDWSLHQKNRAAWNAWSCQAMTAEVQAAVAGSSKVSEPEWRAWEELQGEIAAKHKAAMLARNGAGFAYPGLPDVASDVDLESVHFERLVVLNHAVFSKTVRFDGATFGGDAVFNSAIFSGDVWFGSATFGGAASFNSAIFSVDARFDQARFSGDAWFSFATFGGAASFNSATIGGIGWFASAKFSGIAWFVSTTFSGDAVFRSVTFSEFTDFSVAQFGSAVGASEFSFRDCQFLKPTNFRAATFHTSYPNFAGSILHDKTTFTADHAYWPKGGQADPIQAKASCAVIRHNFGKQGLPEEEHFFYRREMGFAGQSGPVLQRPLYWVFGWLSDYGYAILTPTLWLAVLIEGGTWAIAWGLAGTAQPVGFGEAIGVSSANVLSFLGFHKTFLDPAFMQNLPQWLKVVSAMQAILGVVFLFFLGLGLRTRFRLR